MSARKIEFSGVEWESSAEGVRSKSIERDGRRLRLVELTREAGPQEPCLTDHAGIVLEGELDIVFESERIRYGRGDALLIGAGEGDRHVPEPVTERVLLFLVEDV